MSEHIEHGKGEKQVLAEFIAMEMGEKGASCEQIADLVLRLGYRKQDSRGEIKTPLWHWHGKINCLVGYKGCAICEENQAIMSSESAVSSAQALIPLDEERITELVTHWGRGCVDIRRSRTLIKEIMKFATKAQPEVLEALNDLLEALPWGIDEDTESITVKSFEPKGSLTMGPNSARKLLTAINKAKSLLTTGRGGTS